VHGDTVRETYRKILRNGIHPEEENLLVDTVNPPISTVFKYKSSDWQKYLASIDPDASKKGYLRWKGERYGEDLEAALNKYSPRRTVIVGKDWFRDIGRADSATAARKVLKELESSEEEFRKGALHALSIE
jgi:hypothetical protein